MFDTRNINGSQWATMTKTTPCSRKTHEHFEISPMALLDLSGWIPRSYLIGPLFNRTCGPQRTVVFVGLQVDGSLSWRSGLISNENFWFVLCPGAYPAIVGRGTRELWTLQITNVSGSDAPSALLFVFVWMCLLYALLRLKTHCTTVLARDSVPLLNLFLLWTWTTYWY